MTSNSKEETYLEVRGIYDEIVNNPDKFTKALDKFLYLKQFLADDGLVCVNDKEFVRINLFLDDCNAEGDFKEPVNFISWLHSNMDKHPEFFSKYFKKKANYAQQIKEDNNKQETTSIETYKETIPPKRVLEDLASSPQANDFYSELAILDTVDELNIKTRKALENKLKDIISTITNLDLASTDSVKSALAETSVYKSILTTLFAMLEINISSTSFAAGEDVLNKQIQFFEGRNYSIQEIKQGVIQAKVKIANMNAKLQEAEVNQTSYRVSESRNKSLQQQNSDLIDKHNALQFAYSKESSKPKVEDAKLLHCYVAWIEKDEDNNEQTYYLTSTDKDTIENAVTYQVKSLRKTLVTKEAIKFKSRKDAQDQIERTSKHWKKIDPKSGISELYHIRKAYLVEFVRSVNTHAFTRKKTVNVGS